MIASVLLLTYNEATNLPRCLSSLKWCDDIVVVDSGSTDDTVKIVQAADARILHRAFDNFASQRNFGLEEGKFKHEWVLHLDADEFITESFVARLRDLEPPETVDAYFIPAKIILLGKWLRHAGMYPAYQVRLGRRDKLRFKQVGHGQREDIPRDRLAIFDEPYLHYNFSQGVGNWLQKHLRYAQDESRELAAARLDGFSLGDVFSQDPISRRRSLKLAAANLPLIMRPVARFLYVYFVRRGFLDGVHGALYALMLAIYEGMIAVLTWEALLSGVSDEKKKPVVLNSGASPKTG